MTNLPFTTEDSWALWTVPTDSLTDKSDEARQKLFGEVYVPESFPTTLLPANLETALKQVKYVLVGMNPGNAGTEHPNGDFLNFHGRKQSSDYRLAAAVYGTAAWGAFMTDLASINESDSTQVTFTEKDVTKLEAHLDELGIPADATLIAMGAKTAQPLTQYAQRDVIQIPHYSRANGHWDAAKVHAQLLGLTQK
ncbi:hypothetical protein RA086_09090 [Lactiplantibacillus sp. WILCCON 0030]|uniref:Uracil-DNA glycosylase n=1 Tax=Lactiplantibacillus brownii TaxID=3069269 RepID=A0ABU1ABG8_9LACO|nr:hypothetical protein [Lactiplantibacillus brownii]MDQ7937762.1 hypothetical protein [Lactiplantibacillus brownii]